MAHSARKNSRPVLTASAARKAQALLAQHEGQNLRRRVRIECEEVLVRDASAVLNDHVWCERHRDFARVVEVVG